MSCRSRRTNLASDPSDVSRVFDEFADLAKDVAQMVIDQIVGSVKALVELIEGTLDLNEVAFLPAFEHR